MRNRSLTPSPALPLLLAALMPLSALRAQGPPAAPAPAAPPPSSIASGDPNADRFSGLFAAKEQLRAVYEKLEGDKMNEIDQLMRSKKCQILRVNGDVDLIEAALEEWTKAELKYWTAWGAAEEDRVDGQTKGLASMEADMKRADELVASDQKDRESLQRDLANLEKYGNRTDAIRKKMQELVQDIKDSEARLADAQKNLDEVTIKYKNMKASINTRLIEIRQNKSRVEAFALDYKSYYEGIRAGAQQACNAQAPDTTRTPLPAPKKKATTAPPVKPPQP